MRANKVREHRATEQGSFRVPNSIIQGLTTRTAAQLNRLGALKMLTLLGLLTKVNPGAPEKEVRMRVSEILDIIAVSRQVAHAVERTWQTANGEQQQRRYQARRFSPKQVNDINDALLSLFNVKLCDNCYELGQYLRERRSAAEESRSEAMEASKTADVPVHRSKSIIAELFQGRLFAAGFHLRRHEWRRRAKNHKAKA